MQIMAGRLLFMRVLAPKVSIGKAAMSDMRPIIGNREIVGFGYNGQPTYMDRVDFPLPAIRWKETTPDIQVTVKLPRPDFEYNKHFRLCARKRRAIGVN